jgi:hypothetical protein
MRFCITIGIIYLLYNLLLIIVIIKLSLNRHQYLSAKKAATPEQTQS